MRKIRAAPIHRKSNEQVNFAAKRINNGHHVRIFTLVVCFRTAVCSRGNVELSNMQIL